jgi:predicted DNA-binding transcriptional regulator YafY
MGKQRRSGPAPVPIRDRAAVTAERFVRLYRLVRIIGTAPQTREVLARKLNVDIRGFYRDLDLLRKVGVAVSLIGGRYSLTESLETSFARLPFPDPHLTVGDARLLAKGRTKTHQQLKAQIQQLIPG